MKYRVNRPDTGSKELKEYAEALGFVVHCEGGAIDTYLAWGQIITAVEWKSKGGALTKSQQRLIAKGFPVRFISKVEQIDALRSELMRHT